MNQNLTPLHDHADDYRPEAWRQYSCVELEMWVKLLRKRATHRMDEAKRDKDLADADNYQLMLNEKLGEKHTWLTRLHAECKELQERFSKLEDFVENEPKFLELGQEDQQMLFRQRSAMYDYLDILKSRIAKY